MASPRIPLVLPVRFSYDTHAIQTTSQDVSTEGAFVRCLEPPPQDTEVKLRFYLPGSQAVAEFTGQVKEVVGGAESGFWAAFSDAEPQARERFYALISAHAGGAWRTPVPIGSLYPRRLDKHDGPIPLPGPKPGAAPSPGTTSATARTDPGVEVPAPPGAAIDAQNRRSFPRHRARFLVRFETVQEFVLQYAANISAGGVFVTTDFAPPMDSVVTVVLDLPGGSGAVTTRAQVVHRVTPEEAVEAKTDAGVGVQFIDADDKFREGIDRAIEHILSEKSA